MTQKVTADIIGGKACHCARIRRSVGVRHGGTSPVDPPPSPPPPPPDPEPASGQLHLGRRGTLRSKPQSGTAWEAMLKAAKADPGTPSVKNQDSKHNTNMQAAACLRLRTGDTQYLDKVLTGLRAIISPSLPIGRALSPLRVRFPAILPPLKVSNWPR